MRILITEIAGFIGHALAKKLLTQGIDDIIKVINNPARPNPTWNAENLEIQSSSAPYRIYNIGNNTPIALMEFIETIKKTLNKKVDKIMLPMENKDIQSTYTDVSGLIKKISYFPTTELKQEIEKFIAWYTDFYGANNK